MGTETDEKQFSDVLALFKLDLGISHDKRDTYFNALITTSYSEIARKGITLDIGNNEEDKVLLSDYAVWTYRNRNNDVDLARNIDLRIKRRILKLRSEYSG